MTLQLMERYQQLLEGGQPERHHMYGLAWGKSELAVWRFAGRDMPSFETTGIHDFRWRPDNAGYQASSGVHMGLQKPHALAARAPKHTTWVYCPHSKCLLAPQKQQQAVLVALMSGLWGAAWRWCNIVVWVMLVCGFGAGRLWG